jgi:hypothetical protein
MSHYIAIVRFPDGDVLDYEVGATSRPQVSDVVRSLRINLDEPRLEVRCILTEEEFETLPF